MRPSVKSPNQSNKIAVIGGGWYGCHIALELALKGYNVTLYEKNPELFSEISGLFGIRLHVGAHYPRSSETRRSCLRGYLDFSTKYLDLIVPHEYSVYAVGEKDADNRPSKVTAEEFIKVCKESSRPELIENLEENGYRNLKVAIKLAEPSICIGRGLHDFFLEKLQAAGVEVIFDYSVTSAQKLESGQIEIKNQKKNVTTQFDYVINATSFQALLPISRSLPFQVFYQPCLALVYQDTNPTSEKPFSFIVMEGGYPCIMPYLEYNKHGKKSTNQYVLTHGKWTILASYDTPEEAKNHLKSVDDKFINEEIRPRCEKEINRFWPSFEKRFQYVRWIGAVLAKIKNEREFRSSLTLQDGKSGMIYVLPGKVSNIFDAESEVESLIKHKDVIVEGEYVYVKDSISHNALPGFKEKITKPNTCDLQTFRNYKEGGIPEAVKEPHNENTGEPAKDTQRLARYSPYSPTVFRRKATSLDVDRGYPEFRREPKIK